jgi:hypothetical protein
MQNSVSLRFCETDNSGCAKRNDVSAPANSGEGLLQIRNCHCYNALSAGIPTHTPHKWLIHNYHHVKSLLAHPFCRSSLVNARDLKSSQSSVQMQRKLHLAQAQKSENQATIPSHLVFPNGLTGSARARYHASKRTESHFICFRLNFCHLIQLNQIHFTISPRRNSHHAHQALKSARSDKHLAHLQQLSHGHNAWSDLIFFCRCPRM